MLFFIFFGVAVGLGLRYLGVFGQFIFWLMILFQAGCAALVIATIISELWAVRKNRTPFKLPYGGLTEYAVMVTFFASGLIGSYWLRLPWSRRDTIIIGISLGLVSGATIVYIKGQRSIKG